MTRLSKNGIGRLAGAMLGGVVLLSAGAAQADVRYTSEMKPEGAGAGGGSFRTTTYFKDHRERVEQQIAFGNVKINSITLSMCDKEQTVRLDPDLKIYTVGPIGGEMTAAAPSLPGQKKSEPKGGDGKVVMTYSVEKLPNEKIGELDTRHAMVTMRIQNFGCAGDGDSTMKFEIWTANIRTFNCPARYMASRTVQDPRGCKITYEVKGDSAGVQEAFGGMVVRQKIYTGEKMDKPMMTTDLREYSTAALDAALFEIPEGYKQVSSDEFQKLQQDALLKKFQGGAAGGDKDDKDEEEETKPEMKRGSKSGDDKGKDEKDKSEKTKPEDKKPEEEKVKLPGGIKIKKPKFE